MNKALRVQAFEFRSVLMCLICELVVFLTISALGLWVVLRAVER